MSGERARCGVCGNPAPVEDGRLARHPYPNPFLYVTCPGFGRAVAKRKEGS